MTALVAKKLAGSKGDKEDAFLAGLLHDVGKLAMASGLPEVQCRVIAEMLANQEPMHVTEERLIGITHAEVGAYLLGLWGLPYPIVEAVANHHKPTRVAQEGFDALAAVHIADILVNEHLEPVIRGAAKEENRVDQAYLESLGVADKMDRWQEMVSDLI